MMKHFKFVLIISAFLFLAGNAGAVQIGDRASFYLERNFDISERSVTSAILVKSNSQINIYIEESWWSSMSFKEQGELIIILDSLANEFSKKIYPSITQLYGFEAKPGVDLDNKVAILFHQMKEGVNGYFRSNDGYFKLQIPDSNEREMVYLNALEIKNPLLKAFLAHEFSHVIQFNQKDNQGVQEETWLNEARAEYAITALGYNSQYRGSNLQVRVKDFLSNPSDSLTEWGDSKYDYGVINLFIHYLVDHYGVNVLTSSLKSNLSGIDSINEVLLNQGVKKDFSRIFTDWTIALAINDCSIGLEYCYLNENLKNLKISPTLSFLSLSKSSSLQTKSSARKWSGNWHRIIGGSGDLRIEFSNQEDVNFNVPYILIDKNGKYSVRFLSLEDKNKGEVQINEFSNNFSSVIILPSLQKISVFGRLESVFPYSLNVSFSSLSPISDSTEQEAIQKLLSQIDELKKQIAALQNNEVQDNVCLEINDNLYFGLLNNDHVRCLQKFLKNQGQDIYPEGLVTGYFGPLTQRAVIRFQEKHRNEILMPLGLSDGTGFVGVLTRQKINQII